MPGFEIFNKAIGYIGGLGRNIKPLAANASRVARSMATEARGPGRSIYRGLSYNAYRGAMGAGVGMAAGAAIGSSRDPYGERHVMRDAAMGGMLGLGLGFGMRRPGPPGPAGLLMGGPVPRTPGGAVVANASPMGGPMLRLGDGIPWRGPGRYNADLAGKVSGMIRNSDRFSSARLIR
jgi:hypothetical protein